MKDVIYLLFHLLTTLAKLISPGGSRTVIAENLLLKQQLIIHSRSRQRAPNLTTQDRALLGFWSLFLNPRRIARSAIIIKPSTLLRFHNALKKRKYRRQLEIGIRTGHLSRCLIVHVTASICSPNGKDWIRSIHDRVLIFSL